MQTGEDKIVIVEKNQHLRKALELAVAQQGYQSISTSDGWAAVTGCLKVAKDCRLCITNLYADTLLGLGVAEILPQLGISVPVVAMVNEDLNIDAVRRLFKVKFSHLTHCHLVETPSPDKESTEAFIRIALRLAHLECVTFDQPARPALTH